MSHPVTDDMRGGLWRNSRGLLAAPGILWAELRTEKTGGATGRYGRGREKPSAAPSAGYRLFFNRSISSRESRGSGIGFASRMRCGVQ